MFFWFFPNDRSVTALRAPIRAGLYLAKAANGTYELRDPINNYYVSSKTTSKAALGSIE